MAVSRARVAQKQGAKGVGAITRRGGTSGAGTAQKAVRRIEPIGDDPQQLRLPPSEARTNGSGLSVSS